MLGGGRWSGRGGGGDGERSRWVRALVLEFDDSLARGGQKYWHPYSLKPISIKL